MLSIATQGSEPAVWRWNIIIIKNIDLVPIFLLVYNIGNSWDEIQNCPFHMEGKERPKTEAGHSCLADGRLSKQKNLHTKFVLNGHKTNGSPQLPARILKSLESLKRFSHKYHPDGLSNTLLFQGYKTERSLAVRTMSRTYIPCARERIRNLRLPRSSSHQLEIMTSQELL